MQMFSESFVKAAADYRFLLNRSYPQKATIKLVGDRYQLSGQERSLLYRGVSDRTSAGLRRSKIVQDAGHDPLFIDGYNILFTIGNYLAGRPVYVSDDGIVRDTGELRGRFGNKKIFERTLELVGEFMMAHQANEFHFFLDEPVSNSGRLASRLTSFMAVHNLRGTARTVRSPDHELITIEKGLVCSSDSVIMMRALTGIYDIPGHILAERFHAGLADISDLPLD